MTVLKASDYPKFKPIPRLHRDVVISEKINGTNGLIEITKVDGTVADAFLEAISPAGIVVGTASTDDHYVVRAGSRNRWLTPENDNFGFAAWVYDHASELVALGEGRHYGEWFGKGIQSGYGLDERRFALFNTERWYDPRNPDADEEFRKFFPKAKPAPEIVTVVPVLGLADGRHLNDAVDLLLHTLEHHGSLIAPGFMNPEGVVVWHTAAGTYLKATIHNDEQPKSKVKSAA